MVRLPDYIVLTRGFMQSSGGGVSARASLVSAHHHWAVGMVYHEVAHASHDGTPDLAQAACSRYDVRHGVFLGNLDDGFPRFAGMHDFELVAVLEN